MSSDIPSLRSDVANIGRIYDYLLGGKDHFKADRAVAEKMLAEEPELRDLARANRAFLGRAVRYLVDAGVRQFIDIGTGLPTQGHVHELVPEDAHVVYVDSDPVVLSHARELIARRPGTIIVDGDRRRPNRLLADPGVRRLIDFDQPCAIMLCAVLHFLGEGDSPHGIVATFYEQMAHGSYLVLTHATGDLPAAAAKAAAVREVYAQTRPPRDAAAVETYRCLLPRSRARRPRARAGFGLAPTSAGGPPPGPGMALRRCRPQTRSRIPPMTTPASTEGPSR